MKNKYLKRSKVSEAKYRQVVRLFCDDLSAVQIAALSGLERKTVNRLLMDLRHRIAGFCEKQSPLKGEVEIDESYFGPRQVYTQIVPNASRKALKQVIKERIDPSSTVYSDGWRDCDALIDWGYRRHYRINHARHEFAAGRNRINGIESFWGVAKVCLAAKRGLRSEYFNLHLKECEFRRNMRRKDMYQELLKILREGA